MGAAWGWNPFGWFVTNLGYHDFGCSAIVHGISGFFALGVPINLGPRVGKYDEAGNPRPILPHNLPPRRGRSATQSSTRSARRR